MTDFVPKVRSISAPATLIQAQLRAYCARKKYKRIKKAAIRIQCSWKRLQAQRELEQRKQAADIIRSFIKGFIARREPENDINRQFLRLTRVEYLHRLARNLPKSILDNSWPAAPSICKEVSDTLRVLHRRVLVRNYFISLSPERKSQLCWKLEARELFKGKKSCYPTTIEVPFVESHLSPDFDRLIDAFHKENLEDDEKIRYSLPVSKYDRHGYRKRQRILVLTTKCVYLLDAKDFKIKHIVYLKTMTDACINVSSHSDGLLVLQIREMKIDVKKEGDLILDLGVFLIECLSLISVVTDNRRLFNVIRKDTMYHRLGNGKVGTIKFRRGVTPGITRSPSRRALHVLI